MSLYSDTQENQQLGRTNLYATLKRRWEYLLLGTCIGLGLAAFYYYTVVPVYESNIEILVGQRTSEITQSGTITSAGTGGELIPDDLLATHMRLINSRKLLGEIIKKNKLDQLPSLSKPVNRNCQQLTTHLKTVDQARW